jgi:hypothetical protein
MLVYNIEVPPCNTIDHLAELREKRDALVRARMSKPAYEAAILQGVQDALVEIGSPLSELADMLFECPIRDPYDYKAFLSMRDGQRLGRSLLTIVAQASLSAYQSADTLGF